MIAGPVLALLAAKQQRDSSVDVGRVAAVAMMIRPPIIGLMLAIIMAKQATPPPPANNRDARQAHRNRRANVNDILPPPPPQFFPNFAGKTRLAAEELAARIGLRAVIEDDRQDGPREHVIAQNPQAGEMRRPEDTSIRLTFGRLNVG